MCRIQVGECQNLFYFGQCTVKIFPVTRKLICHCKIFYMLVEFSCFVKRTIQRKLIVCHIIRSFNKFVCRLHDILNKQLKEFIIFAFFSEVIKLRLSSEYSRMYIFCTTAVKIIFYFFSTRTFEKYIVVYCLDCGRVFTHTVCIRF